MGVIGLRAAPGALLFSVALLLAGCRSQPPASSEAKHAAETADPVDDVRSVAEASLGKQSEILLQGDLAQNGAEQLLVVNRYAAGAEASARENSPAIFVLRAAILEKSGGKWSEVLLCDEHLKNPDGYLGGSSAARVSGWRLEYHQDAKQGLEMKFTPAEDPGAEDHGGKESPRAKDAAFDVRWNRNAKRYQSYDQSHERYLGEVPSLETPQSILK
jgi:hypothetical protein